MRNFVVVLLLSCFAPFTWGGACVEADVIPEIKVLPTDSVHHRKLQSVFSERVPDYFRVVEVTPPPGYDALVRFVRVVFQPTVAPLEIKGLVEKTYITEGAAGGEATYHQLGGFELLKEPHTAGRGQAFRITIHGQLELGRVIVADGESLLYAIGVEEILQGDLTVAPSEFYYRLRNKYGALVASICDEI